MLSAPDSMHFTYHIENCQLAIGIDRPAAVVIGATCRIGAGRRRGWGRFVPAESHLEIGQGSAEPLEGLLEETDLTLHRGGIAVQTEETAGLHAAAHDEKRRKN